MSFDFETRVKRPELYAVLWMRKLWKLDSLVAIKIESKSAFKRLLLCIIIRGPWISVAHKSLLPTLPSVHPNQSSTWNPELPHWISTFFFCRTSQMQVDGKLRAIRLQRRISPDQENKGRNSTQLSEPGWQKILHLKSYWWLRHLYEMFPVVYCTFKFSKSLTNGGIHHIPYLYSIKIFVYIRVYQYTAIRIDSLPFNSSSWQLTRLCT